MLAISRRITYYPYYPDFINNEYSGYIGRFGYDNFAGYLCALRDATDGIPILVAEFGVPSSRGVGHYNPLGLNQGGHTQEKQGEIDIRLFQDIFDEGYAGGVFFEWFDEWFKRNWLFMDFEKPSHRNNLWHNIYDSEQTFGIISFDPEVIKIDGDTADWRGVKPILRSNGLIKALRVTFDPVYLYLRLDLKCEFNLKGDTIWLMLDTYNPQLGEHRAPFGDFTFKNGVEFVVELTDSAKIFVAKNYNIYRNWLADEKSPMRTIESYSGEFIEPRLLANRMRITLLGDTVPPVFFYPGKLIFDRQSENSLADWFTRGRTIELRLGWGALNVTDPSSFSILQDDPSTPDIDFVRSDGIALAVVYKKSRSNILSFLPGKNGRKILFSARYKWKGWEKPFYREHLKESYFVIRKLLPLIDRDSTIRELRTRANREKSISASICQFKDGREGAISFSFDDGDMTQFNYAKSILEKYGAHGSFGIVTSWIGKRPLFEGSPGELKTWRMSEKEINSLNRCGHEISSHGHIHNSDIYNLSIDSLVALLKKSKDILEKIIGKSVKTLHVPYSGKTPKAVQAIKAVGFKFARYDDDQLNDPQLFNPIQLKSFVIYSDTIPSIKNIYEKFVDAKRRWMILMYHHIFPVNFKESKLMRSHNVVNIYSVTPHIFEQHVRLARNTGFWVGTIENVGEYLNSVRKARLIKVNRSNLILLKIIGAEVPLSVEIDGPRGVYAVRNSLSDGKYELRLKPFTITLEPNREVIIEFKKILE